MGQSGHEAACRKCHCLRSQSLLERKEYVLLSKFGTFLLKHLDISWQKRQNAALQKTWAVHWAVHLSDLSQSAWSQGVAGAPQELHRSPHQETFALGPEIERSWETLQSCGEIQLVVEGWSYGMTDDIWWHLMTLLYFVHLFSQMWQMFMSNHNDSRMGILSCLHLRVVFKTLIPNDHPTKTGAPPLHTFFPQAPRLTSEFPVARDPRARNSGLQIPLKWWWVTMSYYLLTWLI